jgi:hypothetical protein
MADEAWDYIRRCMVRLRDAGGSMGSGFFVGPNLVLTAQHVVPSGKATLSWNGTDVQATSIALPLPLGADAALLAVDPGLSAHPVARLGSAPRIRELVRFVGYPVRDGVQHEETVTAEVEDDRFQHPAQPEGARLLKFKGGQTVGGSSGSPLVREATMEVAGVVSDSRGQQSDLGGLAVPVEFLLEHVPQLRQVQLHTRWDDGPWRPQALARDGILRIYLDQYLGPVHPFFGRDDELDALTSWLDDEASDPYALLTAQAGAGKSSLLAHWFDALCRRDDVRSGALDVVFVPITIRLDFCTELPVIQRLALQLSAGVPELRAEFERARGSRDELRDCVSRALTAPLPFGRRRLVIIDGVDETVGWEIGAALLPSEPAAGTKVVLAARQLASRDHAGWRAHLNWTAGAAARDFRLGPLSGSQVRDAAQRWWSLIDPEPLGTRLFDLTAGDPLVVGLYLTSSRRDAPPALLASTVPGIEGFFRRWWEEQEKQWGKTRREVLGDVGKAVLNVLSGSFEPLPRLDLRHIVGSMVKCDGDDVDEALRALRRFVVGTDTGFALSHPRLADSRWAALTADGDHAVVEAAFLRWCEGAAADPANGHPASESRYAIRCLTRHLQRSNAPVERWTPIVAERWRERWQRQEAWREGYLQDLLSAAAKFAAADREALDAGAAPPFLAYECEAAWRRGRVDLFEKRIGPAFARELVRHGLWSPERAFAHLTATQEGAELIEALAMIAPWCDEPLVRRALAIIAGLREWAFDLPASLQVSEVVRRAIAVGERQYARLAIAALPRASGVAAHLTYAEMSEGVERRDALAGALARLPDATEFPDAKLALVAWVSSRFSFRRFRRR